MIKCLVIDDEPFAVQLLSDYINKSNDLELVQAFTDPIKAFHFLNENSIDLIFMDIQMPELTGIQLIKLIPPSCNVIFTTAYSEYALESYDFDVVDYLLKPISFERFLLSVEKFKNRFSKKDTPTVASENQPNFIFVKSGHRTLKINLSDILFLESQSDYVAIHSKEKKILTLENMSFFEKNLPKDQFIRVHRSYIISIPKIDFIERNRITINDTLIPISKTYQDHFWNFVGKK